MDIKEVCKAKRKLELDILKLVSDFEEAVGLSVEQIDCETLERLGYERRTVVEVVVRVSL